MRGKLFQGTIKTCSESLKTNKKTGFLLMIIRPEVAQDRAAIATLIARTYGAQGAKIIEQTGELRALDVYRNDLSFIAESDGEKAVQAFSLMTPVAVEGKQVGVVLAPFAMNVYNPEFDVPAFFEAVFEKVEAAGFSHVFALGRLDDLSPLGFEYADAHGITLNEELDPSLLVKVFKNAPKCAGTVVFPQPLLV